MGVERSDMPGRWEEREWLDGTGCLPPAQLAQNLDDLERIKRWLRLDAALWRWLVTASNGLDGGMTVLDVATGGGDVPASIAGRAAAAGLELRAAGIDLHPQVTAAARRRTGGLGQVAIVRGDALRLPLADGAVDVALCSYSLHHFDWREARELLVELGRVARLGVVVIDLTRSWLAFGAAWLLLHLWGPGHRLSRHDGPLSIRHAYTLGEMRRLAAEAGLPRPVVLRQVPAGGAILAPGAAFGPGGGEA